MKRLWDQQCACKFCNLCDSTQKIKLINKYRTCPYIKQLGQLGVTLHQRVLTVLEQRAVRYQNSRTYEELEDERLLDEAIDEMGAFLCASERGEERSQVVVEEQLVKEIRGVS